MMEKLKKFLNKEPAWLKAITASAMIVFVAVLVNYAVQMSIHRNISKILEDDFKNVFQIDSINEKNGELILEGWVFKLNEEAVKDDFEIVLYDYNHDKKYYPKMKDTIRKDINNYFLCEYDYTNSGFVATIKSRKLDLLNTNYEILIQKPDSRETFATGIYISKGELMYVKPEEYIPLDVAGTELEEIIDDGVLRVYRPDVGIYIYQYAGKLYWIADENYAFEEDNSTYVQYQLWTTQVDKLPSHRLENHWYWDNRGFDFSENEITEYSIGSYRVAVNEIPEDYSVTYVWTGYYTDECVWSQNFRIFINDNLLK